MYFIRSIVSCLVYEGRLQSSWTHLITPSRNFVEVRWRSPFRSTSLGKRCTSYSAPPTSRKRAADSWLLRNFLPRSSLFMVGTTQKLHGARSGLYGGCSDGVPPIHFFQAEHRIQFRSRPMRFPNHERGSKARNFEVINGLQHVFEKWVERCKKCIAYQGSVSIERIVLLDFIHRLVSQKIEDLKIYTKYHNTHVHKIHTRVNY
jgi:hypothetical protein